MVEDYPPAVGPPIGSKIDEYSIQSVLGQGGMGVVYRAEDTNLGITVALKMIDPVLARDAAFVRRFRDEARAMARISSPYIVRVMALRRTEHGLFIVMEHVDGGTLRQRMAQGPMTWREAWPILRQTLMALEQAHGVGVVHRDIKPGNIMLTRDGMVKVTDFGLAKMVSDDSMATITQAVAGTLHFMSPEQVRGLAVDARADLFSLGLVAYELLAGRLPFDRHAGEFAVMRAIVEEEFPPPSRFRPSVPPALARTVMRALQKQPDDRYADAASMREALSRLAPAATPLEGDLPRDDGVMRRPWAWVVAAALAAFLAVGASFWFNSAPSMPGQVGGLEASGAQGSAIVLSWTAVRGADTYIVERRPDGLSTWTRLAEQHRGTTLTDSVPVGAPTYWYRVRARNTAGAGPPSPVLAVGGVNGPLGPVGGLRVAHTSASTVSIAWEPVPGALGYTVQRRPAGSTEWTARVTGHPETTFLDAGLIGETTYWYRVRASGVNGEGPHGPPVEARLGGSHRSVASAGDLRVTAVRGASYSVGGIRVAGERSLPVGQHTVRCEAGDHSTEMRVSIRSNETTTLTCHLHQVVNVIVTTEHGTAPWAAVLVNGRVTGQTPVQLRLGPGNHAISVQRDGYEVLTPTMVVDVRPSFEASAPVRAAFRVRPRP